LFNNSPTKILHLEPTTACNAACPLCPRETDLYFNKSTDVTTLSLDQVKMLCDDDFIKGLDKMFMCGNYGDPAAASSCIAIFKHFRAVNPGITLGMNTNGSLRTPEWWKELAAVLSGPLDYVVWSIDGLEDTNHIYRVNTIWCKIVENAQAFINAGGSAHWDMLVYEHNEHQLQHAEELAKVMGFTWFRSKVSKRTSTVEFINAPKSFKPSGTITGPISCSAVNEQSIYMSASGIIYPCCWQGTKTGTNINQFDKLKASWHTNEPDKTCKDTCSGADKNNFTAQWRKEIELCRN
jgi:MoaA/NifB/PqqE/SkfB family radical SAM enzyme